MKKVLIKIKRKIYTVTSICMLMLSNTMLTLNASELGGKVKTSTTKANNEIFEIVKSMGVFIVIAIVLVKVFGGTKKAMSVAIGIILLIFVLINGQVVWETLLGFFQ